MECMLALNTLLQTWCQIQVRHSSAEPLASADHRDRFYSPKKLNLFNITLCVDYLEEHQLVIIHVYMCTYICTHKCSHMCVYIYIDLHTYIFTHTHTCMGLPQWLIGKESTCQCMRRGFHPKVGKIPWNRKWQPIPLFLLEKSHRQMRQEGYSPNSHMTEQLSTYTHI